MTESMESILQLGKIPHDIKGVTMRQNTKTRTIQDAKTNKGGTLS